jgi:hypothetical protein
MAGDWTISMKDLTEKAAASYASLLTHSQELAGRIQRGEVAPTALQDQWRQFSEQEGTTFYRRLNALSSQFFQGLTDLQAKSADDYVQGLLGESPPPAPSPALSQPPPPAPSAGANEWADWYKAVTAFLAEQNRLAFARYQRLLEKVARGEIAPSSIQDYSAKFIQSRGPVYTQATTELNMRFFEGLLELNRKFTDDLFGRLIHDGPGSTDPLESILLELTGPSGSTASSSLVIDNITNEPSEVWCRFSPFRSTDGSDLALRVPLEVEPARFRLLPGESRSVDVRLNLDPEFFQPGRSYSGTLLVNQGDNQILVNLNARSITTASSAPAAVGNGNP